MKSLIFSLLALFFVSTAIAQSVESKTEFNKVQQPAVICEFPYPPALVETVIEEDLKQRGLGKGKSTKGFNLYQAVNFPEISTEKVDFYIRVERKGRREKDISIVTVLLSKGYDNFISGATDASIMQNAMNYVNGLKPKIERSHLEQQIAAQEDQVKKEEKRMSGLVDDASDLEKRKRKIEQDIEDNKKEQEKQKAETEKQKQILESLKAQRKN